MAVVDRSGKCLASTTVTTGHTADAEGAGKPKMPPQSKDLEPPPEVTNSRIVLIKPKEKSRFFHEVLNSSHPSFLARTLASAIGWLFRKVKFAVTRNAAAPPLALADALRAALNAAHSAVRAQNAAEKPPRRQAVWLRSRSFHCAAIIKSV
ncbi:hypothetical protein HPB50_012857 [Hyalomma asiaticum]|uniref:Uncharacterized protein n=1 Tax=Hyalomma asiaticum TaxID=266040 RepID=A0ACB7TH93_HYAAI|nr:hypothetical protein HPB50_012857 [Hyalomma asiaticum]